MAAPETMIVEVVVLVDGAGSVIGIGSVGDGGVEDCAAVPAGSATIVAAPAVWMRSWIVVPDGNWSVVIGGPSA